MGLPTIASPPEIDLARARGIIHAPAGAGKSSLMAGWYPESTIIFDFDDSWAWLPGNHYRVTPKSYGEVVQHVTELTAPGAKHPFKTAIIDTWTGMWRRADMEAGQRYGKNSAGVVEFGKGTSDRDGALMKAIAPLFASHLGVWILSHSKLLKKDDKDAGVWTPSINDKVYDDVVGGADFVFFADHLSNPSARRLLTNTSPRHVTKTRFPTMPPALELKPGRDGALILHSALSKAADEWIASQAVAA